MNQISYFTPSSYEYKDNILVIDLIFDFQLSPKGLIKIPSHLLETGEFYTISTRHAFNLSRNVISKNANSFFYETTRKSEWFVFTLKKRVRSEEECDIVFSGGAPCFSFQSFQGIIGCDSRDFNLLYNSNTNETLISKNCEEIQSYASYTFYFLEKF